MCPIFSITFSSVKFSNGCSRANVKISHSRTPYIHTSDFDVNLPCETNVCQLINSRWSKQSNTRKGSTKLNSAHFVEIFNIKQQFCVHLYCCITTNLVDLVWLGISICNPQFNDAKARADNSSKIQCIIKNWWEQNRTYHQNTLPTHPTNRHRLWLSPSTF